MTNSRFFAAALWFGITLFLTACSSGEKVTPSPAGEQKKGDEQHVVIISIDGVPADYLSNEEIPLPTIRGLAEDGVRADAMIPSTPTKTWAMHTTLATGVHPGTHRVLTNGMFTQMNGRRFVYKNDLDRDQLTTQSTVYDLAHEAGLRTAGINWPVTRNAETLDDNFPDSPKTLPNMTAQLRSELISQGLLADSANADYPFASPSDADYTWTSAATHLIENRPPDLLLFHLLNVDTIHHRYETSSWPAYTAMSHVDTQVQRILDALEAAGIRDQTAIFVVSDHGMVHHDMTIRPNVLLQEAGLLEASADSTVDHARVQVMDNGGSAMVFATEQSRPGDLDRARSILEDAEGIRQVVGPEDYGEYNLPMPDEEPRMGDLFLDAEPGYAFGNAAKGDYLVPVNEPSAKHGHSNKLPELNTLFVASGHGIRSSDTLATVDMRSVAPTAAQLLGLDMESANGEVLKSILE
jgi:predicted AlkP superfamily pyrophosphatase or phosphodiesterase